MTLEVLGYGALAIALYSLVSRRLDRSIISGPMFFTAVGFLLVATELIETPEGDLAGAAKVVVELTLGLVLFSDAVTTNVHSWRDDGELPARLLFVAMPLIILAGFAAAVLLFPEMDAVGAALVATMLAPTDAALGKPVVSNKRTPARIREALNIESGLNDGLALPLLLFFVAIAEAEEGASFFGILISAIGIALIVGIAGAWVYARLIRLCTDRGWMQPIGRQIGVVAAALVIFILTEELGGSGFIATFAGGLFFGRLVRDEFADIGEFAEDVAEMGTMVAFMVFGAVSLAYFAGDFTRTMVIYALLSLTVVRMVPVALSMIKTNMRWPTLLYLGWFGPRGLASLVFAAVVIEDSEIAETDPIITVVILVVVFSVLLHGITAYLGAKAYADWYHAQHEDHDTMIEGQEVQRLHERRRTSRE